MIEKMQVSNTPVKFNHASVAIIAGEKKSLVIEGKYISNGIIVCRTDCFDSSVNDALDDEGNFREDAVRLVTGFSVNSLHTKFESLIPEPEQLLLKTTWRWGKNGTSAWVNKLRVSFIDDSYMLRLGFTAQTELVTSGKNNLHYVFDDDGLLFGIMPVSIPEDSKDNAMRELDIIHRVLGS